MIKQPFTIKDRGAYIYMLKEDGYTICVRCENRKKARFWCKIMNDTYNRAILDVCSFLQN